MEPALTDRRRDLLCVGLLVAITAIVFADLLTLANTVHVRDIAMFIYPDRHVVWERARAGEWLPMWDPRLSGGQPLAANPGFGVFYPPVWLLPAFSNFNLAFNLFMVGHFLLAGAAMFALLRSLRGSRTASMAGALSWMLGSLMVSFADLPLFLYGAAWLPLFALVARRFLIRRRVADFAGAAVVLGVIIAVGEAAMILQAGALLGIYAVVRAIRTRTSVLTAVALTAAIVAGGILTGAAQLIPTLDLARQTGRATGFSLESATEWSLVPARLLELVYPNAFGFYRSDGALLHWGPRPSARMAQGLIFSFYPGLLAAALTMAGLLTRRRGWLFAGIAAAGSYLVALGSHTPLFSLLYTAGLRNVRYPEKFFASAVFVVTVFGALAIDELPRIRRAAIATVGVIGGVAFILYLAGFTDVYRSLFARVFHVTRAVDSVAALSQDGWRYAAIECAVLLAILLARSSLRPALWSACIIVFVLVDLAPRMNGLMPRVRASYYTPPPIAATLGPPAARRMLNFAQWDYMLKKNVDLWMWGRPWFVRNALMPRLSNAWGFHNLFELDINNTALATTTQLNQVLWTLKNGGRPERLPLLLALTGVTDVVNVRKDAVAGDPETLQPIEIVHVGNPRYYFADQVIMTRSTEDLVRYFGSDVQWSPRSAFAPIQPFIPAPGRVAAVRENGDRIDLDVESAGRALLVLTVTAHKYWHVTLDGAAVQPIPANVAFQAIEIPAGRHTVRMVYRDPVVIASALVSALSIAALVAAVLTARFAAGPRNTALPQPSQR